MVKTVVFNKIDLSPHVYFVNVGRTRCLTYLPDLRTWFNCSETASSFSYFLCDSENMKVTSSSRLPDRPPPSPVHGSQPSNRSTSM